MLLKEKKKKKKNGNKTVQRDEIRGASTLQGALSPRLHLLHFPSSCPITWSLGEKWFMDCSFILLMPSAARHTPPQPKKKKIP